MTASRSASGPTEIVRYKAQQDAVLYLKAALRDQKAVALLHGPRGSGKTVVVDQLVTQMRGAYALAVVDGAQMSTPELLGATLKQFGQTGPLTSSREMLGMFTVLAERQARKFKQAVLVLKNVDAMFSSGLSTLCQLAALQVNGRYAMRMLLVSDSDLSPLLGAPDMLAIGRRVIGNHQLGAMTPKESLRLLYAHFRTRGIERPDDVFCLETCETLHAEAQGYPGRILELANDAVRRVETLTVRSKQLDAPESNVATDTPRLVVTSGNSLAVRKVQLEKNRTVIGRSEFCDIRVHDRYVSSQHIMLIRYQDAVVLLDLKSRNGTCVNARTVTSKVLQHDDVIAIGTHRIKIVYESALAGRNIDNPLIPDTIKLRRIVEDYQKDVIAAKRQGKKC